MTDNIANLKLSQKILCIIVFCFPLIILFRSAILNISTLILGIIIFFFLINKFKTDFFQGSLTKYIIFFFLYVLINSLIHELSIKIFLKSLGNFRYLLLTIGVYIVLCISSKKLKSNFIHFNLFLIIFLVFDIMYQNIFGKNIFGFLPGMCDNFGRNCTRFSGMFDQELIAGAYLSQVGMLFFFLLKKLEIKNLFLYEVLKIVFLFIIFYGILLSGERNAFLIFFLCAFFYLIFEKKFLDLFKFILILIVLLTFFSLTINSVKERFVNLVYSWGPIYSGKNSSIQERITYSPWSLHYRASLELFVISPIFGNGFKSFRNKCNETSIQKKLIQNKSRYSACSTHPHNYFLEFLTEQGAIGGIFFLGLIYLIIHRIYKIINFKINCQRFIAVGLGSLILAILFPLKPSGSFFSTFNACLLFYILGFFLYYSKDNK